MLALPRARLATDWAEGHPEWWSLSISLAAWIAMVMHARPGVPPLCFVAPNNLVDGLANNLHAAWVTGAYGNILFHWMMMILAMIPPLAMLQVRHVAVRSFAIRRHRAILEFLAGAWAVWLLLGVASLALLEALPGSWRENPELLSGCLLLAAVWQLTPFKRVALLRCHRTVPLAPDGWRADRDCAGYGVSYGIVCVASCWAMMLAGILDGHGLATNLLVQVIALTERWGRQPRPRLSAIMLTACAGIALLPI